MTDVAPHFTDFDYIVLAVMAFSCIFAFFRGLVREILSLIAWVGAGAVTIHYFPSAAAALQQHFRNPAVAAAIAGVGIYLLALIGFGLINMMILKSFRRGSESGMLDNLLGLMFGAARGALMVSLGFFLLTMALPEKEYPDWLKQSMTRPYLEQGAALLARAAPDALRDIASLQKKMQDEAQGGSAAPGPAAPYDAPHNSNTIGRVGGLGPVGANQDMKSIDTGYSRTTTQQLDRLIDSTGGQ